MPPVACNCAVLPAQMLTSAPAFAEGELFTATVAVAVAEQPLPLETVTLYCPAFSGEAFGMVGFCKLELKPFAPLHAQVTPGLLPVSERLILLPWQTALAAVMAAVGAGATVTVTWSVAEQPLAEAVTV